MHGKSLRGSGGADQPGCGCSNCLRTCEVFSQRFALGDLKGDSCAASVHRTVSLVDQPLKCRRDLLVEHGTFGLIHPVGHPHQPGTRQGERTPVTYLPARQRGPVSVRESPHHARHNLGLFVLEVGKQHATEFDERLSEVVGG
jgi:hypothetical protein